MASTVTPILPLTTNIEKSYRILIYHAYPDVSYSPFSTENEPHIRYYHSKTVDLPHNFKFEGFTAIDPFECEDDLIKFVQEYMGRFWRRHKTW